MNSHGAEKATVVQAVFLHRHCGGTLGHVVSLGSAAYAVLFPEVSISKRTFKFKRLFLPGLPQASSETIPDFADLNPTFFLPP